MIPAFHTPRQEVTSFPLGFSVENEATFLTPYRDCHQPRLEFINGMNARS